MNTITTKLRALLPYAGAILLVVVVVASIFSVDAFASTTGNIREGVDSVSEGNTAGTPLEDIIRIVINIILFLVGVAAVVMLIIGGFRYVTSQGDSGATASAKNTILYAVVGIIVATAAYAIVNFVLDQFS